jgi:curved DNA-binding protein CbpA
MQQDVMTPFVDYYEILQLSPNADQTTIERVYRLLAKKYHPDNVQGGDEEKFRHILEAFRVLSDPVKRAGYDASYERERSERLQAFYGPSDFHEPQGDREIQRGILSLLFSARRRDAANPGVGIYELEKLLKTPEKHLEFHLWYLKEKGWIQRIESGQLAITANGVDEAMKNGNRNGKQHLLTAGLENETENGPE